MTCNLYILNGSETIFLRSFTGNVWHRISLAEKTCDCPEFRSKAGRCPHLTALGIHPLKPFVPQTHPTFSQALSALVKSIRIRRVEDAVYWLVYVDSFKEPQYRFRTARRLLIGSAEDGHSIAVMEKVREKFPTICRPQTELACLATEAVRICKIPNWWQPSTGGPDYTLQRHGRRTRAGVLRWRAHRRGHGQVDRGGN
jgi:hypothetical protein